MAAVNAWSKEKLSSKLDLWMLDMEAYLNPRNCSSTVNMVQIQCSNIEECRIKVKKNSL